MAEDLKVEEKMKKMMKNQRSLLIAVMGIIISSQTSSSIDSSAELRLCLQSKFFSEIERSSTFEFVWINQFIGLLVYNNHDEFFWITVVHLCGRVNVFKLDMKNFTSPQTKVQFFTSEIEVLAEKHFHLSR